MGERRDSGDCCANCANALYRAGFQNKDSNHGVLTCDLDGTITRQLDYCRFWKKNEVAIKEDHDAI